MKNITKLFAIAVVILGFSATSFGQAATTVTGTGFGASAKISTGLEIANTTPLNFGKIIPGSSVTNVTVSILDILSKDAGNAIILPGNGEKAGEYTIMGENSTIYDVTQPTGVKLTGPGAEMAVTFNGFTSGIYTLTSTDAETGEITFKLGATLAVGASQTVGSYAGTYNLTVNHN